MTQFSPIYGTITSITPMQDGTGNSGCNLRVSVMTRDMGPITFTISPRTYVVGQQMLSPGDSVVAFYDTTAPVPMIYPPQYHAVLIAKNDSNSFASFDYYTDELVNSDMTLKLNLRPSPASNVILSNGQMFFGNPGGHYLFVRYTNTTRSIPAQTSPELVIVFCQGE